MRVLVKVFNHLTLLIVMFFALALLSLSFNLSLASTNTPELGGNGISPGQVCSTNTGKTCPFSAGLTDSSYQAYGYDVNTHIDSNECGFLAGCNDYLRVDVCLGYGPTIFVALCNTYGPGDIDASAGYYLNYGIIDEMNLGDVSAYNYVIANVIVDDLNTTSSLEVFGRRVAINSLTATPSTVGSGDSSTIAWSLGQVPYNGANVRLREGANIVSAGDFDGGIIVNPISTTTYTLEVYGPGADASGNPGWISEDVTVTISAGKSGDIRTNISSCNEPCNVIVDYNSSNVSICSITRNGSMWRDNLQPNCPAGTQTDNGLTQGNYTYRLHDGSGGTVLDSVTVTVVPVGAPTPTPTPPPQIPPGNTLTLTASCLGTVNGSWGGASPGNGSCRQGTCTLVAQAGTIVSLDAVADGGQSFIGWGGACAGFGAAPNCTGPLNGNQSVTATFSGCSPSPATPTPVPGFPSVSITCAPGTVSYGGSANVSWLSSNTSGCSVSPTGWGGTSGLQSTGNLTGTTTYTVTCNP